MNRREAIVGVACGALGLSSLAAVKGAENGGKDSIEILTKVRSASKFSNKPVPEEDLKKIALAKKAEAKIRSTAKKAEKKTVKAARRARIKSEKAAAKAARKANRKAKRAAKRTEKRLAAKAKRAAKKAEKKAA